MKLYLNKQTITQSKLSSNGIMVYIALIKLFKPENPINLITVKSMYFALTEHLDVSINMAKNISSGIDELISKNIIKENKRITGNERILDLSSLYFSNDDTFFIQINSEDIATILTTNNPSGILRYYVYLIGTLVTKEYISNYNNTKKHKGVGYMNQSFFIDNLNISQGTVYNYNKRLRELELIYFYDPTSYKIVNGKCFSFTGVYGRFENKDYIRSCGIEYEQEFNTQCENAKTIKKRASSNRTLANKFRYIRDKGVIYSDGEMKKIYESMLARNETVKQNNDEFTYLSKKHDLSIFSSYNFYQKDNKYN